MVDLNVFYVTVLSDKVFDPGNSAPFLDEFAVGLEIEAGLEQTKLLGFPVDL